MDDLRITLIPIQDHLAPILDGWEQMLYHYLFRHCHLENRDFWRYYKALPANIQLH